MNAVANAIKKNKSLVGCKIYVTLCPCNECLKNLIHFGIKQVIYGGITERHANLPVFKASFKIAKSNGLVFKQLSID
jgi:dCMP deaminase